MHHVVIVGGGFGGLRAARRLRNAPAKVTLLDRRNFHLFQPLLYQVATGALSPADICAPLRALLRRQSNTEVLLAEVTGIDVANRKVKLLDGEIPYDTLILAAGVRHHYFGHSQWEHDAPGLKTIEDATQIRRRVLLAFEAAERESDPALIAQWLTFVVVGGGPTGVELAGAIGEIANYTVRHDFRRIDPSKARIILVEGVDRILPTYRPGLSKNAERALQRLGVEVITRAVVSDVQPLSVTIKRGDQTEVIPTHTVLWAAGVLGSPLGKSLQEGANTPLDKAGRVIVDPDLTIPGHPEIFVIGDMANFSHQSENGDKPLPGVAQVAIQQGKYVARLIQQQLSGDTRPPKPFRYLDLGNMATIGRAAAVADLHIIRLSGYLAWLTWLFIHLMSLVDFKNRVLVLMQWAYSYITRNRSARLITGDSPFPIHHPDEKTM